MGVGARARGLILTIGVAALLLALPTTASASKQLYSYFGTPSGFGSKGGEFRLPKGVAVNNSGAGPAEAGEIYVVDTGAPLLGDAHNRIERFERERHGTPNPNDDTYRFVSAWGAGVETGGDAYEICTVAANCRAATGTGGNGSASGNGDLNFPTGIAVDQDTGEVYVTDNGNNRVNVYAGDGAFLRSMGYDVVQSGPGRIAGPEAEQKLLVNASAGHFSLAFRGKATGARAKIETGATGAQKGSKSVRNFEVLEGAFTVGEGISGKCIPPGTTIAKVLPDELVVSQKATCFSNEKIFGDNLPFNASAAEVETALNALPSVGGAGGSVSVTRSELSATEFEYAIRFGSLLKGEDVPALEATALGLVGPDTVTLAGASGGSFRLDVFDGNSHFTSPLPFNATAAEVQSALGALSVVPGAGAETTSLAGNVTVSGPAGGPWKVQFAAAFYDSTTLRADGSALTGSSPSVAITLPSAVSTTVQSGAFEVCKAASGDVCKAGDGGAQAGELGYLPSFNPGEASKGIAVSPPDGNPATGAVFVADPSNHRIETFGLEGGSPGSFGSGVFVSPANGSRNPKAVAIDSRGIVYATNDNGKSDEPKIERYDSEDADGGGVGFLAPIPSAVEEVQQVKVSATAGSFKLRFGAESTGDLSFNVPAEGGSGPTGSVRKALEALPSINTTVFVSGGPGDASGSSPYKITFAGSLAGEDVEQLACEGGSTPLGGGSGCTVTTLAQGKAGMVRQVLGLAVRPDPDSGGPEGDVLYAADQRLGTNVAVVKQFGPTNPPGLTAPPSVSDDVHGTSSQLSQNSVGGVAVDEASDDLYVTDYEAAGNEAHGVYVLGKATPPPAASCQSLGEASATTLTAHCTVDPNGAPPTSYQLEYSLDGIHWQVGAEGEVGAQESPQPVVAILDPPGGLLPNTLYHVRLVATKGTLKPVLSNEVSATTLPEAPEAETVGSPLRTTTTVQLNGRVNPRGSATTYHFEYGAEGPCDANPCEATASQPAGSGQQIELVAQEVEELQPDTTYHYRVVAESAAPGSPSYGSDMTLATRESDAPLSHGHLPGPPGSDRAYEQVSIPDSGGNPVAQTFGFSQNGDRAFYRIAGGTPISSGASLFGLYFAQRTPSGWQTEEIGPPREELVSGTWNAPVASPDFSSILAANYDLSSGVAGLWRLSPEAAPAELFGPTLPNALDGGLLSRQYGLSADGSTAVALLKGGGIDPAHPGASAANLYEIGSGSPQLVSLLPGSTVASCGAVNAETGLYTAPVQTTHWVSTDGSRILFESRGDDCASEPQLYQREVTAEATKLISGPVLSGPECGAVLLKATSDAVFFWTQSRLAADDTAASCAKAGTFEHAGGDVYRYDLGDEDLRCLTCLPGPSADVSRESASTTGAATPLVDEAGTHVYFTTESRLLPGANEAGKTGIYALEVESGKLYYVGPLGGGTLQAVSGDGSALLFRSSAAGLNALGGQQNGATPQFYLYSDRDRSLTCVSCPQDGSAPVAAVPQAAVGVAGAANEMGRTPFTSDGGTVAFATSTALLGADQNTPSSGSPEAGEDVYEWRDGRLLLVTDGLTSWPVQGQAAEAPIAEGVSASGRDVYFSAAEQLTPDALDGYRRLYDARISGGFEFPPPPPPCPLEVCQGTPKGAPEEETPGTGTFSGPGNESGEAPPRPRCAKGKVRRHGKCVARHTKKHRRAQRAAKSNGRASR